MKKTIFKKVLISGLLIISLLLFVSAFSFASELDDIKTAIKEKGAKWIAGETSVSKLPPEQRKLRLGLIKHGLTGIENQILFEAPISGSLSDSSLDWRSFNDKNYVTPVRDQGNCGSCWAFATTGALESYILIKDDLPDTDLDLSEQVLVSCGRAGGCGGGYIDQASNFIRDTGLPGESCYPYTATNGNCRRACSGWWSYTDRIDSWSYVATTSPTVVAIKNALLTYGPLVTTMDVYDDFFSYESGIYSHVKGNYAGGHAILIVGYDDSEGGYFIVKNSWGTDWGEEGFFNIAYSQINPTVQFGYWTIAYQEAACTYSISPTSQDFPAAGGTGTINVTTGTNCNWTAASTASWIKITSIDNGTGNGTVQYKVEINTTNKSRTGSITVAGQKFTVTQKRR